MPAPGRRPAVALFTVALIGYTVVGIVLALRYNLIEGDAASRVANAGYVLYSRHPHVSAVGFVWNPLPSLMEVPILQLSTLWPELKTYALAGVFQSAAFMAGAVVLVRRIAVDRRVGGAWRWIAVSCFALHPMIVMYGGSGMSEAAELFFALWAVRRLLLWVELRRAGDLAWTGIALGLGYLARYEFIPAAAGAAALVGVLAYIRAASSARWQTSLLSVLIVVYPITMAFVAWALIGWLISGDLFAQLWSPYGNDSLVAEFAERGPRQAETVSPWMLGARMLGMQPFAVIATALAVATALVRRRAEHLVAPAIIVPVLLFVVWGQYSATTFGWFRYYMLAVPLVVCVALVLWTAPADATGGGEDHRLGSARLGAALLSLSLIVGFPVTTAAMFDERLGNQQLRSGLLSIVDPERHPADERGHRRVMLDDRSVAEYFDRRHLADGSVLMDSVLTWGIWLASDNPRQFVITSDYDFTAALNRPWQYKIQYIVVSNPTLTDSDAVNRRYPQLWETGAGIGDLVYSVSGAAGDERFRVYRVLPQPEPSSTGLSQPGR